VYRVRNVDISKTIRRQFIAGLAGLGITQMSSQSHRIQKKNAPPRRLHVEDKWLSNSHGHVVLCGLNTVDPWWGKKHQKMGDSGYFETLDRITDGGRGWYPNVVRVPYQHSLNSGSIERVIKKYMRPIVDFLGDRRCYVIIDFHQVRRWDTEDTDRRLRDFWNAVAPAFSDDPHVLYELFNEPTQPFGNGIKDWIRWKETAQPWVDLVKSHAPDTPLIIGSPRWSTYTKYAKNHPFEGDDLIYSNHMYPADFETHNLEALRAVADDYPLFITEWGYVNDQNKPEQMVGSTSEFAHPLKEYFATIPNVNWTAWCADSLWSPAMFDTDGTLLAGDRYMGEFTKQYLAEINKRR